MSGFSAAFGRIFRDNGLEDFLECSEKFEFLYGKLIEANSRVNITAITDRDEVIVKHFADCVRVAEYIPQNADVVDIGCGGGFPTLPLAIVRPDIKIFAVDSVAKKLVFVDGVSRDLGLSVTVAAARAEELGHDEELREKFDVCVSRAVARLDGLSELCLPLVKVGGAFVAMKGSDGLAELRVAENAVRILGGSPSASAAFRRSDGSERYIFRIEKTSVTPEKYPRKYNKIKKEPLK